MFYTYWQNNSGGFHEGPAKYVIIEADSFEQANLIAQNYIYFDGVRNGIDCSCCGDRWNRYHYNEEDSYPNIDGEPLTEEDLNDTYDDIPYVLVVRKENYPDTYQI